MAKTDHTAVGWENVAILAGTGRLPHILFDELKRQGRAPIVVALDNSAGPWPQAADVRTLPPTRISAILNFLRSRNVRKLVLAGGIGTRPRLRDFQLDLTFLRYAKTAALALLRGDDGLLRTVVKLLEREGFEIVGAHEIAPGLLATETVLSRIQPQAKDERDIVVALNAARALGAKDIGQAAIVRAGNVMALEARSGTAAMLKHVAEMKPESRKSGVLAKVSKPGQELRVDMPAIGPDTILQAAKAGLAGIVVEAGHALIIDREEIIRQADIHGLFVCARSFNSSV